MNGTRESSILSNGIREIITTNREAGCPLTRIYEIDSLSHENSRGGRTAQRHSSATARE